MDAAEREGRLGAVPWNPGYPVHTAWDLGIGDATAIWFLQRVGQSWCAVDYYEASGVGLSHYTKVIHDKPFTYGQHIAPHDIKQREWGSGRSRLEVASELGIEFEVAPSWPVDEGIDAVRRLLPRFWFDRARCERGLSALSSYRREWDERRQMFGVRPVHDWASHGCDALRTFATGFEERPLGPLPEIKVETDFDPRELFGGLGWGF